MTIKTRLDKLEENAPKPFEVWIHKEWSDEWENNGKKYTRAEYESLPHNEDDLIIRLKAAQDGPKDWRQLLEDTE
jgi:hypothetical protein